MPHAALCVSRRYFNRLYRLSLCVSMPHAALCVSRPVRVPYPFAGRRVSMPHAALCVSRQSLLRWRLFFCAVSMPHAALCVSRHRSMSLSGMSQHGFNAARSIVCVETSTNSINPLASSEFQCRTQHCVCRDEIYKILGPRDILFQCRTQHCVCRDAVSRSPCPARAEKAFWKDALFCAVFGVCG